MSSSDDFLRWSVADLHAAYERGALSPVEVTERAVSQIDAFDGAVHAFLVRTTELALEQARNAERRLLLGLELGPLGGVPVAVKDVYDLAGYVTTYGSSTHKRHVSVNDSGVVKRLRQAGAVIVGKTNTAEFGQSATTENLLLPDCRNPWDLDRTSGGSSGGSAAAVVAGAVPIAIGSDGGGSVRIPAAFTGCFGLKPTYGLCPDEGGLAVMTDFLCPGPLTRHVADARIALEVMADRRLPEVPLVRPLRIAFCTRPFNAPVDPAVEETVRSLARAIVELGHHVVEADLPLEGWTEIFSPLVLADEAAHRMHLLDHHEGLLTDYQRRTLRAAAEIDPVKLQDARSSLAPYRARIALALSEYDLLVTPATAVTAFPVGQRPRTIAGSRVSWLWGAFPFSAPFNVAGVPAASLPIGFSEGLPVGAQLIAPSGHDRVLLSFAAELQGAINLDTTCRFW